MVEKTTRPVLRIARRAASVLRDAWLIVGIALVLFLGLEMLYRAQGAVRRSLTRPPPAPASDAKHPYQDEGWWGDWVRGRQFRMFYDPYRAVWPGYAANPQMNIDSSGSRRTVHPIAPSSGRRVFMFGGSTMWGWTARDEYTIPSLVAAELQDRGIADVEVVNLAQGAFVLTQEFITLVLELRRGNVPEAVVFLDGNNEVATAFQSGLPGRVFRQAANEQRYNNVSTGLVADVLKLGQYSALIDRLARAAGLKTVVDQVKPAPETSCPDIVAYYASLVRSTEALGETFGFQTVFLWQPLLANTGKTQTHWERTRTADPVYIAMLSQCTALADSTLADRRGVTYFSLGDLFDDDTASVFLDHYGHLTETANGDVARFIVDVLEPTLQAAGN